MKVKLLCNLGTNDFPDTPFRDGDVEEVSDILGAKLVAKGLAIDVTPPSDSKPLPVSVPEVAEDEAAQVDKFTELRTRHDVAPLASRIVTEKPKAEPPKAAAKQQPSQKDK